MEILLTSCFERVGMRFFIVFLIGIIITSFSGYAVCFHPVYSRDINASMKFCGENYLLYEGLIISRDNIRVDCSSAVLHGSFTAGMAGFLIEDRKNVTIDNCKLVNYATGAVIKNSSNIYLSNITLLRNKIGMQVTDSFNSRIVESFDISLVRMLRVSNSSNNLFQYVNKKVNGDFCRKNVCMNENT